MTTVTASSKGTEVHDGTRAQGYAPGSATGSLSGRRALVLLYSYYLGDPRPRRAAEALAAAGMAVEVICLRDRVEEPLRESVAGVSIRRVPLRKRRGGKLAYILQYLTFILSAFTLASFRCLRRRYHLVHVHNMPDVLVFAATLPKLLGAKVLLDLHDPMPELMMTIFGFGADSRAVKHLKRLEKWSMAWADRVIAVNIACKRIFGSRSVAEAKVHVMMNSPDEAFFPFREAWEGPPGDPKSNRPFVLMYHGSLVERHGLDLAVEAVRRVRQMHPNIELRVYGSRTPFLDRVLGEIRGTELEPAVRYLGPLRIEELAPAISLCDVGIIPNRRSIFTEINTPTRIFEYLACGRPVIAPSSPGILDYFGPEDLIDFKLGDVDDLTEKVRFAVEHPEQLAECVRRGRSVYRAHRWGAERDAFLAMVTQLMIKSAPAEILIRTAPTT